VRGRLHGGAEVLPSGCNSTIVAGSCFNARLWPAPALTVRRPSWRDIALDFRAVRRTSARYRKTFDAPACIKRHSRKTST